MPPLSHHQKNKINKQKGIESFSTLSTPSLATTLTQKDAKSRNEPRGFRAWERVWAGENQGGSAEVVAQVPVSSVFGFFFGKEGQCRQQEKRVGRRCREEDSGGEWLVSPE